MLVCGSHTGTGDEVHAALQALQASGYVGVALLGMGQQEPGHEQLQVEPG